mgnify:CR=1 FL=1
MTIFLRQPHYFIGDLSADATIIASSTSTASSIENARAEAYNKNDNDNYPPYIVASEYASTTAAAVLFTTVTHNNTPS